MAIRTGCASRAARSIRCQRYAKTFHWAGASEFSRLMPDRPAIGLLAAKLAGMLAPYGDLVREACRRAGLASPRFRVAARLGDVTQFAAEVGYPVVVKPVDLTASEKVALVRDDAEASRAFDAIMADAVNSRGQPRTRLALVESFVPGEELCVETVSRHGQTTILGVSGKTLSRPPLFLELGSFTPPEIHPELQRDVFRYVRSVLAAIGHAHGLAHVEVRLGPTGPVLIGMPGAAAAGRSISDADPVRARPDVRHDGRLPFVRELIPRLAGERDLERY